MTCEEAKRHDADMDEALRMARETVSIERASWKRAVSHALSAAYTARRAHELRKCSCYVRLAVEADRMNREYGPRTTKGSQPMTQMREGSTERPCDGHGPTSD